MPSSPLPSPGPPSPLPYERYCDEITRQTALLQDVLEGADLGAKVPTCPDWTLADLARHVAGNLRVTETAVRTGTAIGDPARQVPEAAGPEGDDPEALHAWLAGAAGRFAATLRAAGPDAEAQVWVFRRKTAFWARRAALDLVIHRADAALTVGAPYAVAPELAADALDEFLDLLSDPEVAATAPAPRGPGETREGSIHLHATDADPALGAEWLLELGPGGFTWRRGRRPATVALRGPLTQVLLVCYRRLPAGGAELEVLGDRELLDGWIDRAILR